MRCKNLLCDKHKACWYNSIYGDYCSFDCFNTKEEKMRCTICDKEIENGNFCGKNEIHFPICFKCFCNLPSKKEEKMSSELKAEDEKVFQWAKRDDTNPLKPVYETLSPIIDKRIEIIKRLLASRDAQIELIDYLYSAGIMADGDMLDSHKDLNENIVNMFKLVIEAS